MLGNRDFLAECSGSSIYHLELEGRVFIKPGKEAKIGGSHLRVSVVMSEKRDVNFLNELSVYISNHTCHFFKKKSSTLPSNKKNKTD